MEQFSWKNKREVEREIARIAPREAKPEKLREINPEESSLELTINKELREKLECEFTTHNNKRCEATHFLEIDHKHSYSQGGGNELQNLQLLCRQHNQRKAELEL